MTISERIYLANIGMQLCRVAQENLSLYNEDNKKVRKLKVFDIDDRLKKIASEIDELLKENE